MPIYEYQCGSCAYRFDRLQKVSDSPLLTCPECHQDALSKLISAPAFRLSGSGWYETDFKTDKDKKKNLAGDAGTQTGTSDNKTADKSESKSDSSSAAKTSDAKTKTEAAKTA